MKKVLAILITSLIWVNNSFALSEKEAIEKYISDRELSVVEGVWKVDFTRDLNKIITIVIFEEGDGNYRTKKLYENAPCPPDGIPFTKVSKNYYEKTAYNTDENCRSTGERITAGFKVDQGNYGSYVIKMNGQQVQLPMTRIWPQNLIAHNKKFKEPEINLEDNKIVAASSGTGFFVSNNGHIISNHHVIEGCSEIKLTFKGKEVNANVLAVDKVNDLAILKTNLNPSKVFPIANEDASLLEDIIIAGYPLGKKVSAAIKTSKGSITALAGYGDNYSEFQTDAALNQGNSGGPIINQKGNVVGVAVANYGKGAGVESFNFGIKSSTLKTFANANELQFLSPNTSDLTNKDLGKLITEATIYLECHMTVLKIKRLIAEEKNRKAFFSEYR